MLSRLSDLYLIMDFFYKEVHALMNSQILPIAILAASEFLVTEVMSLSTAPKPCTSVGEIPLVMGLLKYKK